ncbi:hypothetical protein ASZ90_006966 [hydrocarbon metagenome]|uniref:Uncharacterized protein n=1 Tax=hydrocarbon metagenome TaxID=938273 RepID=A0A0W8FR80_9ZZZZ
MMTFRQPHHDIDRSRQSGKACEQHHAEPPPDPEADGVADETADPADRDQRAQAQGTGVRRIAAEQREQHAVRGGIAEHDGVGRVTVLADEFEKRNEIGWNRHVASILKGFNQIIRDIALSVHSS